MGRSRVKERRRCTIRRYIIYIFASVSVEKMEAFTEKKTKEKHIFLFSVIGGISGCTTGIIMGCINTAVCGGILAAAFIITLLVLSIFQDRIKTSNAVILVSSIVVTAIISFIFTISLQPVSAIRNVPDSNSQLILETSYTRVYYKETTKSVYSVTSYGGEEYISDAGAIHQDKSEILETYDYFICSEPINEISNTRIYLPTVSSMENNEYVISFNVRDKTYVSKIFIAGITDLLKSNAALIPTFTIKHTSEYADRDVSVFCDGNYYIFANDLISFAVPYATVPYNKDDFFRYRFEKFIKKTIDSAYVLADNVEFKYAKSFTVGSDKFEKMVFYYQITDGEMLTGVLLEKINNDGTSDICYVKDTSPDIIDNISVAG